VTELPEIPAWVTQIPAEPAVHNAPGKGTQWEGMSQNQIAQLRGQLVESIVSTITQALTGLFLPGPLGTAFEQLKDWADNIGEAITESLTSLFGRIEDATGVDLSVLLDLLAPLDMSSPGAFFASLMDKILAIPLALGNIVQGVLNGILTIPERLGELVAKLRDFFLGPNSPLNAFNIFGLLQSWNLPFLPISSLTNKMPNLLVSPGFSTQDSIGPSEQANGWEWDPDDGRTDPGCARVDAIGNLQQILQSITVPVADGQKVNPHVYVKWQGLVYTGTDPILLDLVRFDAEGFEIGKTTLESLTTPAASSGGDWLKIDGGEYTVPDDGTTQLVIQFRCRENCSAGSIWWDDAELKKTNTAIPQNWVLNLVPDLGGIRDWIQDVIDAIISAIRGIPFVGGTIAHILLELTGWREDTDDAAATASDAYIGLGVTQKIITAASTNTELDPSVITTPADEEVKAALEAQTQVIVAQSAYIEQVNTKAVAELNAGVRVLDPVETTYVGELDPLLWQEFTLEGSPGDAWMESADGSNITMGWTGSPSSTKMYRWIGDGVHTLTNRQKVTATIAQGLKYPFLDGRRPHHAVYCRVSDDGTKWVRAYVTNKNSLIVDYRNGGATGTLYNSGEDWRNNPPAGSALSLEAGFGTNDRMFRVLFGNIPVALVEDTGSATDITQLGHGVGMRTASGFGPGAYTQYTAIDNAPAPVPGTHLHVARLTTDSSTIAEDSNITVFSSTALKQNGIDWNGTYATIKTSDTYTITLRIKHSSYISNSNQDACVLAIKVDGVLQPLGPSLANGIGGLVGQYPYIMRINALHATFTLPLNAGQQIQPYLYSNNNTSFPCVGDTDGILSYMTITRT
jgi:hypothetical protein